MANLQVRDIDSHLYEALRKLAKNEHRSISQEVVMIIEKHLSDGHQIPREQTEKFIRLFGSWEGMETAESIVHAIRSARKNSGRFKVQNALFN